MPYAEFRYPDALKEAVPSLEPLITYRATLPTLSDDDIAKEYDLCCYAALSVPFEGYRVYKQVQRLLKDFADTSKKSPEYLLMSEVDRFQLWTFMISTNDYHLPGFTPEEAKSVMRSAANRIPNETTSGMVCTTPIDGLKEGEVIVGFFR